MHGFNGYYDQNFFSRSQSHTGFLPGGPGGPDVYK